MPEEQLSVIAKKLSAVAKSLKIQFTLHDKLIDYSEVFSDTGFLPAFAKRADQLSALCLGYGVGAAFDEDEKAKIGIRVKFDDVTPNVLRLMCMVDVLEELRKSAPSRDKTPLDELMYD